MTKYELWEQRFSDYLKNVSTEQLIEDSRRAGIILEPIKTRKAKGKMVLSRKMKKGVR